MAKRSPPALASLSITASCPSLFVGPESTPLRSGCRGHDHDEAKVGGACEGRLEQRCDLLGPEILILHVDERASPTERLGVHAGDASLAVRRERIRRPLRRIRPKHLHGVGALRRRGPVVRGKRLGGFRLAGRLDGEPAEPDARLLQRRFIVPTFAERLHQVGDGGPVHLGLDVVPWRSRTERRVERLSLRVAFVTLVVPTPVTEVDAADEGEVLLGATGVQEQHQLLMMRPSAPDTGVQEQDPAGAITISARSLASPSLKPKTPGWERQRSPRTSTPRPASPESESPSVGPLGPRSSSESPLHSVSSS